MPRVGSFYCTGQFEREAAEIVAGHTDFVSPATMPVDF